VIKLNKDVGLESQNMRNQHFTYIANTPVAEKKIKIVSSIKKEV